MHLFSSSQFIPARGLDMKKISYSPDVDVLMISFDDRPIAYAEKE